MTDCPHCDGTGIRELNDAVRKIKADQTARAVEHIKRTGAITVDEAIKLLEGLEQETDQATARELGGVICLLAMWSEALAVK